MVKLLKIIALSCGAICLLLFLYFVWEGKGEVYYGAALFGVIVFLAIASSIKKVTPTDITPPEISKLEEPVILEKGFRDIFGDEIVKKENRHEKKKMITRASLMRVTFLLCLALLLFVFPKIENEIVRTWLSYGTIAIGILMVIL